MKLLRLLLVLLSAPVVLSAQTPGSITNKGDEIILKDANTVMSIRGDYTDNIITGTLYGGFTYNGSIGNAGTIYLGGYLYNNANKFLFSTLAGKVVFDGGSAQQRIQGNPVQFNILEINKSTGFVATDVDITIANTLNMVSGLFSPSTRTVNLGNLGIVTNETSARRIISTSPNGRIRATGRVITGNVSNIAGLGLSLEVDGSLGAVTLDRHFVHQGGAGSGSINRYYKLDPTNKNGELISATMSYFDEELRSVNEPGITFYGSQNNGVAWSRFVSQRNTTVNTVKGFDIPLGALDFLFTLADSVCAVLPYVKISPRDTVPICSGNPVVLSANSPGLAYLWNTMETTEAITVSSPGKYYVRVMNTNGCFAVDSVTVVERALPVADFSQEFVCEGLESAFTNLSTVADVQNALTYHWDFGVITALNDTSILESPTFKYNANGQYTVTLKATSKAGCEAVASKTYVVHPKPEVKFAVSNNNIGTATTVTNQSSVLASIGLIDYEIVNFAWDFGDPSTSDDVFMSFSPQYTYGAIGEYPIRLTAETNAGCIDSLRQTVKILKVPAADFTYNIPCDGEAVVFTNESSVITGAITYEWTFGDGSTSTDVSPSHLFATTGEYTVTLQVFVDGSLFDEKSSNIIVSNRPIVDFELGASCQNADIDLISTSTIAEGTLSYHWDFGDMSSSTDESPAKQYTTQGTYTITLTATSNQGCTKSVSKSIAIGPEIISGFVVDNVCFGEISKFTNTSTVATGSMSMAWDFGDGTTSTAFSPSHTYAEAGEYLVKLTVTNPTGCTSISEKMVEAYALPVIPIDALIETCEASYLLDAGNAGAEFTWTGGSTNQTLLVTTTGSYTVQVKDTRGCVSSKTIEVKFINTLMDALPATLEACGRATLDAANAGSSYLWSTGEATQKINVTESGLYSVEITTPAGCVQVEEVNVTVLPALTVDLGPDLDICPYDPIILDAGVEATSYLWSTGATTRTIEITASGRYIVAATNAINCVSRDTIDVIVRPLPVPSFTYIEVCEGIATPFFNTSSISDGTLSYSWDFGDGATANGDVSSHTYAASGTYTVKLRATANTGCTIEASQAVTVLALPAVSMPAIQSTCGDALELDAGEEGTAFAWSAGTTDRYFTATAPGQYSVSITNALGCVRTVNTQVFLQSEYIGILPEAVAACDVARLDAGNPGATYLWSTGFTGRVLNATVSGEYSVTVIDQNGCIGEETVKVHITNTPRPSITGATTTCSNQLVTLTASVSGSPTYQWSTGENTRSIQVNSSGLYTVTTTLGECSASDQIDVVINPIPVVRFSAPNSCERASVIFQNNTTVTSGTVAFLWNFGDGNTSTDRSPSHQYQAAGDYVVTLRATTAAGCFAEVSQPITIFPTPVIDFPAELASCAQSVALDAGNIGSTYLWSNNATSRTITVNRNGNYGVVVRNENGCSTGKTTKVSFVAVYQDVLPQSVTACDVVTLNAGNDGGKYLWSSGDTTRAVSFKQSGNYTVQITDRNGCVFNDQIAVTINPSPQVNLGEDIRVCADQAVTLNAGAGMDTYKWSNGNTTQQVQVTTSGTYSVQVTRKGCTASDEIKVTIDPLPVVNLGADRQVCDALVLDAGNPGSTYLWSDGSTLRTLTATTSGTYNVRVTTANGCTASDEVALTVVAAPQLTFPQEISVCSGQSALLDALNPGSTYFWSTGATTQTIQAPATGRYSVRVTNAIGCTIERSVMVRVQPKVEFSLGDDRLICTGSTLRLVAPIANVDYLWRKDGAIVGNEQALNITGQGTYWLDVTTAQGCVGSDTVVVKRSDDTVISRFLVTSEVLVGDTVAYKNISIPLYGDHFWNFGDGTTSRREDPVKIFLRPGLFNSSLTVTYNGCSNASVKQVNVIRPGAGRTEEAEETTESKFETPFLHDDFTSVVVFPNPFVDVLTVAVEKSKESPMMVIFYDLNGKVWFAEEFANVRSIQKQYNLMTLPAGTYLLAVKTRGNQVTRKILKR